MPARCSATNGRKRGGCGSSTRSGWNCSASRSRWATWRRSRSGRQILEELGVAGQTALELNSLGNAESREAYRKVLVDYFEARRDGLSEDSLSRLARNPLRILDSKDAGDRAAIAEAPLLAESLDAESSDFFAEVRAGLDRLGIAYTLNPRLVRGLDYYCHTAFEFTTDALGAQGAVIARRTL